MMYIQYILTLVLVGRGFRVRAGTGTTVRMSVRVLRILVNV